jgi:hypothetical protein
MLSSDWLMKGVFFTNSSFFSAFPPLPELLYLLNSAEYLTASKQWHASRFRASDHLDHLIFKTFINLRKQEKYFQRSVFLEQTQK